MASLSMSLKRIMVLMDIPPTVFGTFASVITPCWSNFSVSVYQFLPFLLAYSLLIFNLFLRKVTTPILQTTYLWL